MTDSLRTLLNRLASVDVLVIGDAMLDTYSEGVAERLCPEAPVPVVRVTRRTSVPGGAANSAVNVAALGGRVALVSVIGDDSEGKRLSRALAEQGVNCDRLITDGSRQTLAKHRVIAGSQMVVRFDQGSTGPVDPEAEEALIAGLKDCFPNCGAVIVSDYSYGVLTPRVIAEIARLQTKRPRVLAVDAKDFAPYRRARVTVAKPSYRDAIRLLGLPAADGTRVRLQQVASCADQLLELTGAELVALTLDRDGALFFERGNPPYRTFARASDAVSAAGAGDTFAGALALALAAGAQTAEAAELASAAAAVVVAKAGTATCSLAELHQRVAAEEKALGGIEQPVARVAAEREQGRRIVFTNGCFDILHRGHIAFLNRAKALGDVLIVGINTDAGVRRLKGSDRPINTLEDRIQVLAALSSVDCIVPFDDDTPAALIRAVHPDIYVKGGDYSLDTLPEAALVEELGGAVQILPYIEDRSTTRVIERIRGEQPVPGSGALARGRST
jgi:D-beta-D-heptose 7-phosphate kinase / D-beta-D-heptose 1-phosphate adenosyltransferase